MCSQNGNSIPELHNLISGFRQSDTGQFQCIIGCARKTWMYLAEAEDHEDTEQHVTIVRDLDRAVPPSSPPPASSPPQAQSDPPEISRSSPAPVSSPSQCVSPLSQSSSPQPSSPPIYSEMPHSDIFTVQGPHLESDGDDLIYDNWAGSWGLQMPKLPENEVESGDETDAEFEGEGECEEVKDYYGASVEEVDLTADDGSKNANPDDWWPWANREVRVGNPTHNHCADIHGRRPFLIS
jgi:hypothetical protein